MISKSPSPLSIVLSAALLVSWHAASPSSAAAATITVNAVADTAANDGLCTLREAIAAANTNTPSGGASGECAAGALNDTILFAIPGSGPHTIQVVSSLPTLLETTTIDGYSQPGSAVNTLAEGSNAVLAVGIDGGGGAFDALRVSGNSQNSVIRGLRVTNFSGGISVQTTGVVISGNFVGTDGVADLRNGATAILFDSFQSGFTLGGPSLADRNVIAGGSLDIRGSFATIENNLIGTDAAGNNGITANVGMFLLANQGAQVRSNLIGGNVNGILVVDGSDHVITGNRIGISYSGANIGGSTAGIEIQGSVATGNSIGGLSPAEANRIANFFRGVFIWNATAPPPYARNNRVLGNSISGSTSLGIEIFTFDQPTGPLGVNPNDPGDGDDGANGLQNAPVLGSAGTDGAQLTTDLAFSSAPNTTYRIEFFHSSTCTEFSRQGETFLSAFDLPLDGSGVAFLSGRFVTTTQYADGYITATATNLSTNETSEFSNCAEVGVGAVDVPVLGDSGAQVLALLLALIALTQLRRR